MKTIDDYNQHAYTFVGSTFHVEIENSFSKFIEI